MKLHEAKPGYTGTITSISGGCGGGCKGCGSSENSISNSSYTVWEIM